MLCSNCGKHAPFTGKVCPYCHTAKDQDQARHTLGLTGSLVGAAAGWFVGTALTDAPFVCAFFGAIVGTAWGFAQARDLQQSNGESQ